MLLKNDGRSKDSEEVIQKSVFFKALVLISVSPSPSLFPSHTHTLTHPISSSLKSVLVTGWLPVISNNVWLVVLCCEHTRGWLWCDSKSTRCSKYNFPFFSDFCGPTCAIHFQPYEAGDLTRVSQQATRPKREDSGNWLRHPLHSQNFAWNRFMVLIKQSGSIPALMTSPLIYFPQMRENRLVAKTFAWLQ